MILKTAGSHFSSNIALKYLPLLFLSRCFPEIFSRSQHDYPQFSSSLCSISFSSIKLFFKSLFSKIWTVSVVRKIFLFSVDFWFTLNLLSAIRRCCSLLSRTLQGQEIHSFQVCIHKAKVLNYLTITITLCPYDHPAPAFAYRFQHIPCEVFLSYPSASSCYYYKSTYWPLALSTKSFSVTWLICPSSTAFSVLSIHQKP